MKIFHQQNQEEIVESITRMIEQETKSNIFTLRILNEVEEGLEALVVLEDKSVLMGLISVQTIDGKLACRMQANYI